MRTIITPQRWQRLQEIFEGALALDPATRPAFVAAECATDVALREQVLALLATESADAGAFERRMDEAIAGTIAERELPAGTLVGAYRVVRLLGRGGMGTVYLAERADGQFQRSVALKLVARGFLHEGLAARFRAERQILARLNHPNIARLFDGGHTADGAPYLVMEFIEGLRIDAYCDGHGLDLRARIRLFAEVCTAVQYAHQHLVVHRDLKPSNILVTAEGRPKLLDFGIAKLLDPSAAEATQALTRLRDRLLTPDYASPEQVRGEPIATVSDVYSLGVLLYELLAGVHPFRRDAQSIDELERCVCEEQPLAPSERIGKAARDSGARHAFERARELAGDIDNIVLKAMHKDRDQRFPSVAALAQDLESYLAGRPVQARPDGLPYRMGKFIRRNALAVASSAGAVLLIAALTTFYTLRLAQERDTAQRERLTATRVAEFMLESFRLANPNETQGNAVTARALLDSASARIERDLASEPRLLATLMRNMGRSYSGLGLWPKAREVLERAVALERRAYGGAHAELAQTLQALGHVYHNMNLHAEAQGAFEEAWSINESLGTTRSVDAIRILHSLGSNLRAQQHFAAALDKHRRAEELARALDPPHPQVLGQVLMGYGMTHSAAGDHRSAERYARESLVLLPGVVFEGIDLYANSLATLADALTRQYRLEEAEKLHREFVARQTQMLGRDHPLVGRAWNNLAHVLRFKGDYGAAQAALTEALRIHALQPGGESLDIAIAHHNLGSIRREAGDLTGSLASLESALAVKRRVAGPRSPQTVSTLIEQAAVWREIGDPGRAGALLDEAAALAAEHFDRDDRRHAMLLLERGRQLLLVSDAAGAEPVLKRAVQLAGDQDPGRIASAKASWAQALARTGRAAEARAVLEEVLRERQRIMPAEHPAIAEARARLAEVGGHAEADPAD